MGLTLPESVYHLVEEANWHSVQKHGLLPAADLIKRAKESETVNRSHRATHSILKDGTHIRDRVRCCLD